MMNIRLTISLIMQMSDLVASNICNHDISISLVNYDYGYYGAGAILHSHSASGTRVRGTWPCSDLL